jgi:hypothetical protein
MENPNQVGVIGHGLVINMARKEQRGKFPGHEQEVTPGLAPTGSLR